MTKRPSGKNSPYAVLLGADNFIGLQSARVLARFGVPVAGVAKEPTSEFCKTKYVKEIVPADPEDEDEFIHTLVRFGARLDKKAVLFPCLDPFVQILSRNRKVLEPHFSFSLPDIDTLDSLVDKVKFAKLGQKEGVRMPKTRFLHRQEDVVTAVQELKFPCIVKPYKKEERWWKVSKSKVNKVHSTEELLQMYGQWSKGTDILIVQEAIPGNDGMLYSCNCYFDHNSKLLVMFIARKIRQWPIEMGCTSLGEECRNDEVLDLSLNFFSKVPFQGLGYLEIKKSAADGKYYLIEANIGRPTGRSSLADTSGVPLLYTMYCDCTGRPLPEDREQKYTGRKWMHITWDTRSALSYFLKGELTVKEWWNSVRGKKTYAVFSLSDPMPFVWKLAKIPVKVIKGDF